MKILVVGFESLGCNEFNPSIDLIKSLPVIVEDSFIVKLEVPVQFKKAIGVITAAIDEYEPDAVICVGQAGGRVGLTSEFVAINYINSDTPDDAGVCVKNKAVISTGPAAYITDLPVNDIVAAIKCAGVPAEISYTAGTSLSNSLMYGVAHHIDQTRSPAISGFLHIPYATHQAALLPACAPSLSTYDIRNGIEAAVRAIALYLKQRDSQPIFNDTSPLSPALSSLDIDNVYYKNYQF